MRLAPAIALLVLALLAAPAGAATFERGTVSYSAAGSWTSSGPQVLRCETSDTPDGRIREIPYTATETVDFETEGSGRVRYQGIVGRSVFFNRVLRYPKVTLRVTRTGPPPAACRNPAPDCGERTLTGVLRPEFAGGLRPGDPLELDLDFAPTRTASTFDEPFSNCPLSDDAVDWFARAVSPGGTRFAYQARALDYPSARTFYRRTRRTLEGSSTDRGATLRMRFTLSRSVALRRSR